MVPIIGTNGARCADDVIRFLLSGARAVECASLVLTSGPAVFQQMLEHLNAYASRKNLARLQEIVGKAADASVSYGDLPVIRRSLYPWDKYIR